MGQVQLHSVGGSNQGGEVVLRAGSIGGYAKFWAGYNLPQKTLPSTTPALKMKLGRTWVLCPQGSADFGCWVKR